MFIHLHIQSAYSLLSSTVRIDELVSQAKVKGFSSLALTDRNVMYGSLYFYKECKKQGIKPIIGLIADVLDGQGEPYPLILLARNNRGYQNLLKISSAIKTKASEGLPLKWLKAYSGGLISISPGAGGRIETYLAQGMLEQAKETALLYQSMFGEKSFYLSMQRLSLPGEEEAAGLVKLLSEETGIPMAATNPVFYLDEKDALAREVLVAVKNGEKLADENRLGPASGEYYLKTGNEMAETFKKYPNLLENTLKIAEQCEVSIPFNRSLLPKYPVDGDMTADEMLTAACRDGLKKRDHNPPAAYEERLDYELSIIKKMKFSDYFLIVWDFMKYARQNQILTGPGRGSAAGSMVAYVLEITDVDPIKHNLLFERFLNPERISMPDIDIDFPDNRREEVISYVASKYGELHVAQIITFGTLAAKAALRDTGRVFGLNPGEQERLSKMIPSRLGIALSDAYKESKALREFVNESELNKSMFETALKIEGLPRHTSTHAAGVVISDMPLTDIIAIQEGHEGVHLTQFPMDLLEELGLLKMDFLGLRNLTLLDNILTAIQKGTGQRIDIASIPGDDESTFRLLSKGETTGVFQFESEGIRKVIMKLAPTRFEDIVAVNALYRPGPMENIPLFIERKHGLKPIDYLHPALKPILEDTYGVIVYQEQIMQIASTLAGFTLGEADLLRRAVSKKKKEILDKERAHFVNGAKAQGYQQEIANEVYDSIVRFANYGFNRSHAVAYSFIAYQLAFLKAHFPKFFMAALLTSVIGNEDKIAQYVREAKEHGIAVLPPSINKSIFSFQVESEGIRFSLAAIKGVGGAVLKEVFHTRRQKVFDDLFDFCLRVSSKIVNRKILDAFVYSGAFDEFGEDRKTLLASLDIALHHAELVKPGDDQFDLFAQDEFSLKPKYTTVDPMGMEDKLFHEKSVLGLYLSNHPLAAYRPTFQHFGAVTIDKALLKTETKALLGAYITSSKNIRTKKGEVMAFLSLSDEGGDLEAVIFPNVYKKQMQLFDKGNIALFGGTLEERDGKKQLIVQEAFPLEDLKRMKEEETSRLFIKIEKAKQTVPTLQKIKQILLHHKGTTKVMLYYESEDRYIQLSIWDWITPSPALLQKLKQIAGEMNVVLKKE
ncbi:DNA polymerase III subunit alpha [Peribacillus cavernae]|uniref:DNA polymerase III subunit alpha n=1 Tax=Peribacillus cavernae TaxID=1674310 RepID=A0A433HAP3_9BACI|nr:DNA polymerase III subunit alpha [Peribacillus cavernae]MDQ0220074.1 DNA polymerase-3 subunit alpha [Peribacillus cavernae]RUQ25440.1 DNA polymerase III subunit alpha [Peribacillus cavernae]